MGQLETSSTQCEGVRCVERMGDSCWYAFQVMSTMRNWYVRTQLRMTTVLIPVPK